MSLMISPELRHSFLLSSSTVFMFSIHTASTGPSNMYHFLLVLDMAAPVRMREERIPSVLQPAGGGGCRCRGGTAGPQGNLPARLSLLCLCFPLSSFFKIVIRLKNLIGKIGLFGVT